MAARGRAGRPRRGNRRRAPARRSRGPRRRLSAARRGRRDRSRGLSGAPAGERAATRGAHPGGGAVSRHLVAPARDHGRPPLARRCRAPARRSTPTSPCGSSTTARCPSRSRLRSRPAPSSVTSSRGATSSTTRRSSIRRPARWCSRSWPACADRSAGSTTGTRSRRTRSSSCVGSMAIRWRATCSGPLAREPGPRRTDQPPPLAFPAPGRPDPLAQLLR